MHGLSTSMLLLLHSTFMLRVVRTCYQNHGIVFLNFCGNPAVSAIGLMQVVKGLNTHQLGLQHKTK